MQESIIPEDNEAPRLLARVNAYAVRILQPFVAHDDIRVHLCGLNIRPLPDGTAMLTATNGHMMAVMRDPKGFVERELIVRVGKDGIKHGDAKHTFDEMTNGAALYNDENVMPLFIQPGRSVMAEGEDCGYPRAESVASMEGYSEGLRHTVNPQYLQAALSLGKAFGAIRFFSKADKAPVVFTLGAAGELEPFGLIMPMDECSTSLPDWLPARGEFSLSKSA